jgi:hypothetical protein
MLWYDTALCSSLPDVLLNICQTPVGAHTVLLVAGTFALSASDHYINAYMEQVRFKLDRKQLNEIPQFAVEPEHFSLLGVRFKYPMLGTPMPADFSKRVYSDYGPDLPAADNNVLVLVRDAARLAHVPPKERGLLLYDDMSPSGPTASVGCSVKANVSPL